MAEGGAPRGGLVRDAGLDRETENPDRCGVIFSSGIGGFETVGQAHKRGEERGYDTVSPFMIPMIISNMAAGHMAIRYGFRGMCSCVVTACAGGTNAVGDAFRHIRDGYAEVMLCGGGGWPPSRWRHSRGWRCRGR